MMPRFVLAFAIAFVVLPSLTSAQVSPTDILKYTPKQPNVDYETPTAAEAKQCRVDVVKVGRKGSGYALYGPNGQMLRRFDDTDGDQNLDQYRYFKLGLEVYRDVDTDADGKIDQYRWLNTNGTRWGVDTNGDQKIDGWKVMSAEEASREAVQALAAGDIRGLQNLLLSEADIRTLGLSGEVAKSLQALTKDVTGDMQRTTRAAKITRATKWVRFDSSMLTPQVVPAESGKASRDVTVYENVMAIIDNGGQTAFLQIGEVIRVGNVWKLTQVPQTIDGNGVIAGGVLMQPTVGPAGPTEGALTDEMQALVDKLTELDKSVPGASASDKQKIAYNRARASLLGQLAAAAPNEADANNWRQQQVEVITAAFQGSAYPNGVDELRKIETAAPASLQPFVAYRRVLAEYTDRLFKSDEKTRAQQQDWLLSELQSYLKKYPRSADAPEAMWQLGSALELSGKTNDAAKWYTEAVRNFSSSPSAQLANGALTRLNLKGRPLKLSGQKFGGGTLDIAQYKGKVTAVIYWATWNADLEAALPDLKKLYTKYKANGFEIVGVNVDPPGADVAGYIKQNGVSWPHIAEPGGLDSAPARQYGIFVLPHIMIVDRKGVVVDESATVADLSTVVPRLLLEK